VVLDHGWIAGFALAGCILSVLGPSVLRFVQRKHPPVDAADFVPALLLGILVIFSLQSLVVSTAVLGTSYWILLGFSATLLQKGDRNE
jgi:hypothetical protein